MRKVDPVRREEKRREILEAAIRCFVRTGFHGSSVAAVCAEAGISPGHLYHYFTSKEAIIEAMVTANLEDARRTFGDADTGEAGILEVLVRQFTRNASDDRRGPLLFDMLAEAARNPVVARILQGHSRGMETLLADLLRRGQASGEIDAALDPDLVAPMLISVADGSRSLTLRRPDLTSERSRDMLKSLLERYLDAGRQRSECAGAAR